VPPSIVSPALAQNNAQWREFSLALQKMTKNVVTADKTLETRMALPKSLRMKLFARTSTLATSHHFHFTREVFDFLLSPVSVPGEVIADLELLWTQRQARP